MNVSPVTGISALLGRLARRVERGLHPWRRARAIARLRAHQHAATILVVCQGNIIRSPFAAAILAGRSGGPVRRVLSAGFIGPGRASPLNAFIAARQWDIDLGGHRSQMLTPALVAEADLIVVMEPWQATQVRRDYGRAARDIVLLGDLDPGAVTERRVFDPWDRTLSEHVAAYERIVRCTTALHEVLMVPAVRPAAAFAPSRNGSSRVTPHARA